jgi:hypothetical protein
MLEKYWIVYGEMLSGVKPFIGVFKGEREDVLEHVKNHHNWNNGDWAHGGGGGTIEQISVIDVTNEARTRKIEKLDKEIFDLMRQRDKLAK